MTTNADQILRNETHRLTGTWRDSNGTAINVTGYTAEYTLKHKTRDYTYTQTTGFTLGGAAGTVALVVTDETTATFPLGECTERIDVISAGGVRTCLMRRTVEVVE